jgi:hypothetical protein
MGEAQRIHFMTGVGMSPPLLVTWLGIRLSRLGGYHADTDAPGEQSEAATSMRMGFPVLRLVSYAYMPSPLPRQVQWSLFARLSPLSAAFPVKKSGRLLQLFFRGLLSVHSCYGLHARRVAKRPSTPKAPTASLPPLLLRLLPGGANQFPGGNRTR